MRLILLLVLCGFCSPALCAQSESAGKDEAAVREVIKAYVGARERHDAKALSAMLTPEADQLVSSGEWRKGRDELVRGMLASSERNSGTRTINVESVRFIGSDVAIADGRYEIAGAGASDSRRMWTSFIVRKSGAAWRIEAIRNMLPSVPSR
jgi:uncharacterized protein (TIGR02246 family)